MAQLIQSQLWDDTEEYALLATSGRPSSSTYTINPGGGVTVPVSGVQVNQNGLYVPTGDAWVRFQIIQTQGITVYPFVPGEIIQVATTPTANHPLNNTGYTAVVVRNSKINNSDAIVNYPVEGVTYNTRLLNDVTLLPLEGSAADWASLVTGNVPGNNGRIRRTNKVLQEDYSTILEYGFDGTRPFADQAVVLTNDATGGYRQGDGEEGRFNREHSMILRDAATMRLRRFDINFGFPRTTDGADPLVNRNNWLTENEPTDNHPRYQATTRNFITALADANPEALWNFTDRGGEVNFVGTDFTVSTNGSLNVDGVSQDQGISFGRPGLEIFKEASSGTTSLSIATAATGLEGFWSQREDAGNSSPLPDLQDFMASPNFFGFDLSNAGTNPDSFRFVLDNAAVDIFYYGTVDANGGLPVVLNVPIGSVIPIAYRGTPGTRTIFVDFRQLPGYVEPDFSNATPVFFFDTVTTRLAQCNFAFNRPGSSDQNFSSVLRFDDIPHMTDSNIVFENTSLASRVEIDGRTIALNTGDTPPYFDYVTIDNNLDDPSAEQADFAIVNAQAGFSFSSYGLSARAATIEPFQPDTGTPVLGSNDQNLNLIDPEFCISKPYAVPASKQGRINVLRTLKGTISNGKDNTINTNITLHQSASDQVRYNIRLDTNNNPEIARATTQPMFTPRLVTKDDPVVTLTDGDPAIYAPNTHPYNVILDQYVMPHTDDTNQSLLDVTNRWRVAITEPGCVPYIREDLEVGASMQDAAAVTVQLNPESTDARPRYPRDGITAIEFGIGNIALEQDAQYLPDFDFMSYQQPSDTNPLNNLFDLYTGIHLLASFREDENGAQAGNHLATVDYVESATGRRNYLTFAAAPGGAINLSPEGQQTDTWVEGDGRVGYGKVSWHAPTRIIRVNSGRPAGEPTQVATPFTAIPPDGRLDIQGISFQGTAGMVNAEGQPINCGMHNAVISNVAGTNGGTYEQVTFMMDPGDYTFNSANFAGNLADIVFVNTMGTAGGAVNIAFTGAAGTAPNTGNFTTRGTVNFPDVRTFIFPTPGQVVISRPATTATGFEVLTIGGNTTNHVTTGDPATGYPLALPDNLVPIGTTVNVYYKPYDTVSTTPFGDSNRSRFHLVNVPVEWDTGRQNMSINIAGEVNYDIVRQLTPIEEQDMGTTQDDQYTPPTGRFAWDFYDGSATSTSPINGARLRINLHAPGATGVRTVLNEGQTKQFLYWMMERQDLNRTGRNHFIEAVAALGHPVNHEIDDNTALPIRLFESSAFVDTRTMTMAKFDETDPLNSFTGLGPVPFNPGRTGGPGQNAVYAIQRSDALNASGNRPGDNNDGDGTHENSRDLYLIDETRVEAGNVIRGLPDIGNQNPTDGLTETQVTQATTVAINNSQANNILHWHADGFSSKIPVGRTYNPNTDYSEN